MGKSTSVAQFSSKIGKAAAGIEHANRDALIRAGNKSVDVLNSTIVGMVGGDRIMHNVPRPGKNSKLSAKAGFVQGTTRALVKIGPKGPVALIDQGAPGHIIGLGGGSPEGAAFTGKRKKRTLGKGRQYNPQYDDGNVLHMTGTDNKFITGPVYHPGMGGKHRWTQVRDRVLPGVVRPIIFAPHLSAVAKAFL